MICFTSAFFTIHGDVVCSQRPPSFAKQQLQLSAMVEFLSAQTPGTSSSIKTENETGDCVCIVVTESPCLSLAARENDSVWTLMTLIVIPRETSAQRS